MKTDKKRGVFEISLRPYPGKLLVIGSREEFSKACLRILNHPDTLLPGQQGRFMAGPDKDGMQNYLVWATNPHTMAHEVSHVILDLFEMIGIYPAAAGGEPFCYLLSQILLDIEYHGYAYPPRPAC